MEEEEKQIGQDENGNSHKWSLGVLLLLLIGFIIVAGTWFKRFFERKVLKSELAKRYGVTTKVLVNWMVLLCPEPVKKKYVDGKTKKVAPHEIYEHLGKPEDRPATSKGRPILNREDFIWALGVSPSTLKRKLKTIDRPCEVIGMSYETFGKMRDLPPRQVSLILEFMNGQGYPLR